MKFLNNYKLFESIQDEISKYLEILGTDKDEINYIFIDLIDARYEIKYKLLYLDKDGNYHKERRKTSKPCIIIDIDKPDTKYIGARQKFKNTEFLFILHACIDRFIKMFSDKCDDIEYSIGSAMDIEIRCEFSTEEDSNKVELSKEDLSNVIRNAVIESIIPQYTYHIDNLGGKCKGSIYPQNPFLMAEELYKTNTNKKESPSNWDECDEILENLLKNIKIELSEKLPNCQINFFKELSSDDKRKVTNGRFGFSDNDIYYIKNGEVNKLMKVRCHNNEMATHAITVGRIFKKMVGINITKVYFEFELV